MTDVVLIRHGPTEWNDAGRIQGHTDIPLSVRGRAVLARKRLPARFAGFRWVVSPLRRARETAALLGAVDPEREPRLAEMRWGEWEGRTLADLRDEYGEEMARREGLGLDFRATGGESPRELCARLAEWLAEVAARGEPVVAATHKGVLRGALSLATGWDYTGKPPVKLDFACAQHFRADRAGCLAVVELNIPLEAP